MACKIITIFSNKGGVGKTFITVNLGTALALAEKKVLMIDFDLQAGQDMARMLNLSPRYSIVDVIDQLDRMEDPKSIRKFTAYHASKLEFLPVVRNTGQISLITPENVKPFFKVIMQVYDYIIVDGGRSFNENLVSVFGRKHVSRVEAHAQGGHVGPEFDDGFHELVGRVPLSEFGVGYVPFVIVRKSEMLAHFGNSV